jgi:hypothetical protein
MSLTKSRFFRFTAQVVSVSVLMVASIPAESMAYIVGSGAYSPGGESRAQRDADTDKVQRAVDTEIVGKRLMELGLTAEEVNSRLEKLSDEELRSFASRVESLHPGGGGLGVLIGALLVVCLLIAILKVSDKTIVLK